MNLTEKFRHDGKRYWVRNKKGEWITLSARSTTIALALELGIPKRDATKIRNTQKKLTEKVDDPTWREDVDWLVFTKGRQLFTAFGRVEFCDSSSRNSEKSMEIADFNRVLQSRFPSKGQIAEDSPLGLLLL